MKYKIAEKFKSIQGEGFWTGTPMVFVRLSQCPVGGAKGICKSWDGSTFICDTGVSYQPKGDVEHHPYVQVQEELTAGEIAEWSKPYMHLCLTGGEPFIYNLEPFVNLTPWGLLHIETSGTEPPPGYLEVLRPWITLSPKYGWYKEWLRYTNEMKVLVRSSTRLEELQDLLSRGRTERVYLQPVDGPQLQENTQRAIELCHTDPNFFKLSLQTHKIIGVR